ncbi:MarR family winged helix-turn-helix transcriptional regulator [Saccharothrix coeruleofusca]|uniref:MarR family transcriptional regulator n=1 Tax=Saccharothrix coeruleofusca TaxID=33919 RepID=A0A918AM13_9PSEU|nr:MarR family transcriptional regulator [Saccharothrix coeruleofusca]GGP55396.1 MarR family transcriptional regulator [Saccharothrix coeruleofusca]
MRHVVALTARGAEFTELLVEVFRVNGLLLAAGDRLAAPAGLTSARWQVLGVVDHGPCTVAAVARTMGLTRQAVRQTAVGLVREGMAEFRDNPADRRARLLVLTPRGRSALRRVERAQAAWANETADRVPLDDLRAACGTLRDLADLLER